MNLIVNENSDGWLVNFYIHMGIYYGISVMSVVIVCSCGKWIFKVHRREEIKKSCEEAKKKNTVLM